MLRSLRFGKNFHKESINIREKFSSERTNDRVTIEWRPSPNYGELTIVGYKVYINNRLVAILSHDQLTYTFTNGSACEDYIVYVQALSNDKNISSPMSRGIKFTWPGIKPGVFRRLDNGQTGTVVVAWEHPQTDDDTEKVIGFRVRKKHHDKSLGYFLL